MSACWYGDIADLSCQQNSYWWCLLVKATMLFFCTKWPETQVLPRLWLINANFLSCFLTVHSLPKDQVVRSVPSKIFASRLVSKKCRQHQKKLGALYKFSWNAFIFNENIFHQPFVVNVQKNEKMVFTFSKTYTGNIFWWTTKKWASHSSGNKRNEQYANFLHKCETFLSDMGCPMYGPDWLFFLLFIAYCHTKPVDFNLFYTATHYNHPL